MYVAPARRGAQLTRRAGVVQQMSAFANVGSAYLNAGVDGRRLGTAHASIVPYQAFASADAHLTVGALNDGQWQRLVTAMARELDADAAPSVRDDLQALQSRDWRTNPQRVAHREPLLAALQRVLRLRSASRWEEVFESAQVPCCRLRSIGEAFEHEQTRATHMIETVQHPLLGSIKMAGFPVKMSE